MQNDQIERLLGEANSFRYAAVTGRCEGFESHAMHALADAVMDELIREGERVACAEQAEGLER